MHSYDIFQFQHSAICINSIQYSVIKKFMIFFIHRFYLGLALALQKNGPGPRAKETISYLLEAMETLLTLHTKSAMTPDDPR